MTGLTAAREYIVLALMEAGSMYRDGAESFLAEYDAAARTAALNEAADLARSHVRADHTTDDCAPCALADVIEDELRRMAAVSAPGGE